MNAFKNDIVIGSLFVLGFFGFMSGEFLISTASIAIASIISNIKFYRNQVKQSAALCD